MSKPTLREKLANTRRRIHEAYDVEQQAKQDWLEARETLAFWEKELTNLEAEIETALAVAKAD